MDITEIIIAIVGALAAFMFGFFLGLKYLSYRLPDAAKAFVGSKIVMLDFGQEGTVNIVPARFPSAEIAESKTGKYRLFLVPKGSSPFITPDGTSVYISARIHDHFSVVSPLRDSKDVVTVNLLPEACREAFSPECNKAIAEKLASIGTEKIYAGPMEVSIVTTKEKFVAWLFNSMVTSARSTYSALSAVTYSLASQSKIVNKIMSAIGQMGGGTRNMAVMLIIIGIIILIVVGVLSALAPVLQSPPQIFPAPG